MEVWRWVRTSLVGLGWIAGMGRDDPFDGEIWVRGLVFGVGWQGRGLRSKIEPAGGLTIP